MANRLNRPFFAFVWLILTAALRAAPSDYFAIHVVDDATGRGVPLVYLQTTYKTTYLTDSNGYVAFLEPGLMDGSDVWFKAKSYGYQTPTGLFGVEGVKLHIQAGGSAEIRLKREQIAERLYRITGYGIDRDSRLLGKVDPTMPPPLRHFVTGQDTVQTVVYREKMLWLWGDTDQLGFGLGNFHTTGAWSKLPDAIDPDHPFALDYIADKPDGFVHAMVDIPSLKEHPIWLDGLIATKDSNGEQRLIARYAAVDSKMVSVEEGLVLFDDDKQIFKKLLAFDGTFPQGIAPTMHPIRFHEDGERYVLAANGVRVKDNFESVTNPKAYESLTCLDEKQEPVRDAAGKLMWHWQTGVLPINQKRASELIQAGKIKPDESPWQLIDMETKKPIRLANGSIAWNDYLKRWTYLFGEFDGASQVGEIWFAIAHSPLGPWREARKVATHAMPKNNNDFYNPIQHDDFIREHGRFVYFEGTFVNTFSGNPAPTPYYDYNNITYRIDLADPRMKLPEPPAGLITVFP